MSYYENAYSQISENGKDVEIHSLLFMELMEYSKVFEEINVYPEIKKMKGNGNIYVLDSRIFLAINQNYKCDKRNPHFNIFIKIGSKVANLESTLKMTVKDLSSLVTNLDQDALNVILSYLSSKHKFNVGTSGEFEKNLLVYEESKLWEKEEYSRVERERAKQLENISTYIGKNPSSVTTGGVVTGGHDNRKRKEKDEIYSENRKKEREAHHDQEWWFNCIIVDNNHHDDHHPMIPMSMQIEFKGDLEIKEHKYERKKDNGRHRPNQSGWSCLHCNLSGIMLATPFCPGCKKSRKISWVCKNCTVINSHHDGRDYDCICTTCDWKNNDLKIELDAYQKESLPMIIPTITTFTRPSNINPFVDVDVETNDINDGGDWDKINVNDEHVPGFCY